MVVLLAQYDLDWDLSMSFSSCRLRRAITCFLVMSLAVPFAEAAPAPPQQAASDQQSPSAPSAQSQPQYSDSQAGEVDAGTSQSEVAYPDNPEPVRAQSADQSGQPNVSSPGSVQPQQGSVLKPVGTAAAPYEKTTGVAASRPAGAVIAPAKQRRARSILIRVSVVVGAAAAIGTVALLSRASPSRPN